MVELYINDKLCDLTGEEEISIDYAIAKIGEIESRTGARSAEFSLPMTANNKAIFEVVEDVNSTSKRPYKKYDCKLFVNGVDQLIRFATLESIKGGYNLRVYGANTDFFSQIKDLLLRDLDLSEYDHFWTKQTVIDSRTNTEGYIYPLIDYHADSPNSYINYLSREIDVRGMFPSLFYEDILNKCCEQLGFTLNIKSPAPQPLLLPFCGNDFVRNFDHERYKGTFTLNANQTINYGLFGGGWEWDAVTSNRSFFTIPKTVHDGQIDFQDRVTISGTLNIETNSATAFTCVFNIGDNIVAPQVSIPISINNGTTNITIPFTDITNNFNHSVFFYFNNFSVLTPTFDVTTNTSMTITDAEITQANEIKYDLVGGVYFDYVTPNSIFGDLSLGYLFKNYCLMYGKLINVNQNTKQVDIIGFDDIKNNLNNGIDWSSKLDFSDDFEFKFSGGDYGQINNFTYADDSENIPSGTNGVLIIDDDNVDSEQDLIEVEFSPTNITVKMDGLVVNQIGVMENLLLQNEKNYRVLYLELIDGADLPNTPKHIVYKDGTTTNVSTDLPFTWFIARFKQDNLGFGRTQNAIITINGLINDYYSTFAEIITDYKVVNCLMRLNAADIATLDFTRPVYIQHFNAYFYISQIKGYNPNSAQSTMVELVKLF